MKNLIYIYNLRKFEYILEFRVFENEKELESYSEKFEKMKITITPKI